MSAAPRNLQPSGTGDHDYPLGAIHFAGQSPIIQMNDGPGFDGLANPYTVPSAVFWKLGQSGPGDIYRFREISLDAAAALAEKLTAFCSETSIS
jgi:urea carboxylase